MSIRWVPIQELATSPALANLLPIQPETLARVTASIRDRGFDEAEPIVVWEGVGVVVDGHTRLEAAKAARCHEVCVIEHVFADEDDAVFYALSRQGNRRNLTNADLLRLVADLDVRFKRSQGRPGKLASPDANSGEKSAAVVGRTLGVSQAAVERARAVNESVDIAREVAAGNLTINGGYQQVQERKRAERDGLPPKAASTPIATRTVQTVGGSAVTGIYTVAEWQALKRGQREELLTAAPHDANTGFNRTNENVEWALWTWNPVTGCLHNCPYCYARDIAARFYPQGFAPAIVPERLHAARHMKVPAAAATNLGEKNVFVCSMADLFGKWVPQEWIDAVLAEVRGNPQWNFLFLTKFPRRLSQQDWPDNAWVGTTVDKQFRAPLAEQSFRNVRAGVRWLSCEPLLERLTFDSLEMFDWIVVGGSSKSTQTPEFNPPIEWFEHLLNQARRAGCKVYLKPNFVNRWREYPGFDEPLEAPEIGTGWVDGEPLAEG